jgi:Na+/melibiose symporter-like transporter
VSVNFILFFFFLVSIILLNLCSLLEIYRETEENVNAEEKFAEKEAGKEDAVPTDEAAKEKEGDANEAEKEEEDKVCTLPLLFFDIKVLVIVCLASLQNTILGQVLNRILLIFLVLYLMLLSNWLSIEVVVNLLSWLIQ